MSDMFREIAEATDEEIARTASMLVLAFVVPMRDEDVEFIPEAVGRYEESGALTPEDRKRLIAILHTMLAPSTN